MSARSSRRPAAVLCAAVLATAVVACTDNLTAGSGCGVGLCPEQAVTLSDTVVDLVGDTTVLGFPSIGAENYELLASRGDTLDTRVILRYDSLSTTFHSPAGDSSIVKVDSAFIDAGLVAADSLQRLPAPFTIEVYDVDTVGVDTTAAALLAQFRPDRLLGSRTFQPESLTDSLRIPVRADTVLAEILAAGRLRVGLRLVSSASEQIRIPSTQLTNGAALVTYATSDSGVAPVVSFPRSNTPANATFLAGALADFVIVAKGVTTAAPGVVAVGGLPGRRALLTVNIPSYIVDSSSIVRATLLLTQRPNFVLDAHDSIPVGPAAVLLNPTITDVRTMLNFISATGDFNLNPTQMAPGDSGVRSLEVVALIRTWKGIAATINPRVIALHTDDEGTVPGEIDFFSTSAPAAVRPRLRITFVPRTAFGLP